jgi:hypothetical protein
MRTLGPAGWEVLIMKRFALALCALAALASPAAALDTPTSVTPTLPVAVLNKPYAVMLGDMIALNITQTIPVLKANDPWAFTADVVAKYDRESDKIRVSIFGTKTSVDEAKAGIEYFRGKVIPALAAQIMRSYHVTIDESDLTLVYITRFNMHEVIRREGTKYLVAE